MILCHLICGDTSEAKLSLCWRTCCLEWCYHCLSNVWLKGLSHRWRLVLSLQPSNWCNLVLVSHYEYIFKQYYKICDERWNIFTFHFFHHKTWKWLWMSPYFKPSVYLCWLLCVKWTYSKYSISYLQYHSTRFTGPGKGKIIADPVKTATPLAFMFTTYCLFSLRCPIDLCKR